MTVNPSRKSPDVQQVTADEATEILVHHLGLAAAYFQCIHDDKNETLVEEIKRQLQYDDFAFPAAIAFAAQILECYEADKRGK